MRRAKITIVGAGNVGATTAHWCAAAELGDVVLLDIPQTGDMPKGKALDLRQAGPIVGFDSDIIGTTDYKDTHGSDVVVITAGIPRKPGMSRDDLLSTNAKIMTNVCEQIRSTSKHAVVIVVSNPLDAMVQRALQVTGFEPQRVIGAATDDALQRSRHGARLVRAEQQKRRGTFGQRATVVGLLALGGGGLAAGKAGREADRQEGRACERVRTPTLHGKENSLPRARIHPACSTGRPSAVVRGSRRGSYGLKP